MSGTLPLTIVNYQPDHCTTIRTILTRIGWSEQYVAAAEHNAEEFSRVPATFGVYVSLYQHVCVGFIFVQYYAWNQLAQIHGLAVDPPYHRQGIASKLVTRAEQFAQEKRARGIYVDTPVSNERGRRFYEAIGYHVGYMMPRYYEAELDGVTYQKFFG